MKKTIHSKQAEKLCGLLTKARKNTGYTQQQLADLLNRPQSFVAKYELGERRLDVIEFLTITKILKTNPIKIIKLLIC
jgi:transcriptional regulator with XRE-family HTH domain